MLSEPLKGDVKMDKKISIRLREEEYDKIAKCAVKQRKSLSGLVRSRVLAEPEQGRVEATNEMKIQMLKIKGYLYYISSNYPEIDFQPVDDAMEVLWDELY